MTTSILDAEELLKKLTGENAVFPAAQVDDVSSARPVSGQDLINRVKELFTPDEAETLARRIEEGREQSYD
jgi:hypothetical protein